MTYEARRKRRKQMLRELAPDMTYEARRKRREQMLRELAPDMADLVASGDITEQEANTWLIDKADQWR